MAISSISGPYHLHYILSFLIQIGFRFKNSQTCFIFTDGLAVFITTERCLHIFLIISFANCSALIDLLLYLLWFLPLHILYKLEHNITLMIRFCWLLPLQNFKIRCHALSKISTDSFRPADFFTFPHTNHE